MTKEEKDEIRKMFPLTLTISDELFNSNENIGQALLSNKFPNYEIFWGLSLGNVAGILLETFKEETYEGKKMIVPHYLQRDQLINQKEITFQLRR